MQDMITTPYMDLIHFQSTVQVKALMGDFIQQK